MNNFYKIFDFIDSEYKFVDYNKIYEFVLQQSESKVIDFDIDTDIDFTQFDEFEFHFYSNLFDPVLVLTGDTEVTGDTLTTGTTLDDDKNILVSNDPDSRQFKVDLKENDTSKFGVGMLSVMVKARKGDYSREYNIYLGHVDLSYTSFNRLKN